MPYQQKSGLGLAAAYQVSGKPWVSGSIDINAESSAGTVPYKISFPLVTQWINVRNHDNQSGHDVYLAFSANGLPSNGGTNHIKIIDAGATTPNTPPFEMHWKVTEIYLEGTSDDCEVLAGLTGIDVGLIPNNWSGSSGVG